MKTFAKSTAYKILSLLIMGTYILSKPFSKQVRAGEETFATKLKFKAKVLSATKFSHKMSKIFHCWGRKTFGQQLLVTTKNVARQEVLNKKEDQEEAHKMIEDLFDLNLRDNLTSESRENLSKKKISVTKNDGECFGTSLHFVSNLLNLDEYNDAKIAELATQYQEGVPARAAANQTLYEAIKIKTTQNNFNKMLGALETRKEPSILNCSFNFIIERANFLYEKLKDLDELKLSEIEEAVQTYVFQSMGLDDTEYELTKKWVKIILEFRFGTSSNSQDPEEIEIRNIINSLRLCFDDDESKKYTARLNGLIEDEDAKVNEIIGNSCNFSSTEEQLKNFNDLPEGAYTLGFDTWFLKDKGHVIAYIKTDTGSFLFDPNYGLIKCGQDPKKDLLKLMYLYPESPKQAKEPVANYHLEILKFAKY